MAEQKSDDKMLWSYILIAGTTSSPSSISTTDKKRENGNYLDGISSDLHNMKNHINSQSHLSLDTILQDMKYLSKWTVLDRIRKCAQKTIDNIFIYYTGHGEKNTGNWCFKDGVVSLEEVIETVSSVNTKLRIDIQADCCYSGDWVVELKEIENKYPEQYIYVYAACLPGTVAWDTPNGGMFTLVNTGKNAKKDFKELSRCCGKVYGKVHPSKNKADYPYEMKYLDC